MKLRSPGVGWTTFALDDGTYTLTDHQLNFTGFPFDLLIGGVFRSEQDAKQEFADILGYEFDPAIHTDVWLASDARNHEPTDEDCKRRTFHVDDDVYISETLFREAMEVIRGGANGPGANIAVSRAFIRELLPLVKDYANSDDDADHAVINELSRALVADPA